MVMIMDVWRFAIKENFRKIGILNRVQEVRANEKKEEQEQVR